MHPLSNIQALKAQSHTSSLNYRIGLASVLSLSLLMSHSVYADTTTQASPSKFCEMAQLTQHQCEVYEGFQADADIIRLRHLEYWAAKIYRYKEKTGKFPFEGEADEPILVEIATPQQQQYITRPPNVGLVRTMTDFINQLSILEPDGKVGELYDPQYAPDVKPNYYLYMIDGDTFYFAVHTHQAYPFARKVADDYYKVEVSNIYNSTTPYILRPDMLFVDSQAYQNAVNKPMQKPDFFVDRQMATLYATQEAQNINE